MDINRCPFCLGDARLTQVPMADRFLVTCTDCGASGPISPRKENAIASWNAASSTRSRWLPISLAPANGELFLVDGGPIGDPRLAYFSDGALMISGNSYVRCTNIAPPRFARIPKRD